MKITLTIKVDITNKLTKTKIKKYKMKDIIRVIKYEVIEEHARNLNTWEKWMHKITRFKPVMYYSYKVELTVSLNQIGMIRLNDIITFPDMEIHWQVISIDKEKNTLLITNTKLIPKLPVNLSTFVVVFNAKYN